MLGRDGWKGVRKEGRWMKAWIAREKVKDKCVGLKERNVKTQ